MALYPGIYGYHYKKQEQRKMKFFKEVRLIILFFYGCFGSGNYFKIRVFLF